MSEVILKFTLPEERYESDQALKAAELRVLIDEWSDHLRSKTKYGDGLPVSWEEVREDWVGFLKEADL